MQNAIHTLLCMYTIINRQLDSDLIRHILGQNYFLLTVDIASVRGSDSAWLPGCCVFCDDSPRRLTQMLGRTPWNNQLSDKIRGLCGKEVSEVYGSRLHFFPVISKGRWADIGRSGPARRPTAFDIGPAAFAYWEYFMAEIEGGWWKSLCVVWPVFLKKLYLCADLQYWSLRHIAINFKITEPAHIYLSLLLCKENVCLVVLCACRATPALYFLQ